MPRGEVLYRGPGAAVGDKGKLGSGDTLDGQSADVTGRPHARSADVCLIRLQPRYQFTKIRREIDAAITSQPPFAIPKVLEWHVLRQACAAQSIARSPHGDLWNRASLRARLVRAFLERALYGGTHRQRAATSTQRPPALKAE
jgi:hypothetical protein